MYKTAQVSQTIVLFREMTDGRKQLMAGIYDNIGGFGVLSSLCMQRNIGSRIVCTMASSLVITPLSCRTHIEGGMCSGSKYRFCVPQNRRTNRKAARHGSGKEVA